ncbi:uncharacterized protein N7473_009649 [Penicillium subrubescens]|uniref:Uncharacterized protein n=1 Tax=Penicillium subrubescens TaxID=1316194 RepID=A0A1Q5THC3_9EURO|nr:uncharacterized protein N7473_009649 [Penicillium subrubescens]KAJ5886975.1 hypothetical protein N7473_009649 [Penicillium subrubescens]OKO99612.1 hypothetical protein PENSUB_8265 [Penicillium subrubescens]
MRDPLVASPSALVPRRFSSNDSFLTAATSSTAGRPVANWYSGCITLFRNPPTWTVHHHTILVNMRRSTCRSSKWDIILQCQRRGASNHDAEPLPPSTRDAKLVSHR